MLAHEWDLRTSHVTEGRSEERPRVKRALARLGRSMSVRPGITPAQTSFADKKRRSERERDFRNIEKEKDKVQEPQK